MKFLNKCTYYGQYFERRVFYSFSWSRLPFLECRKKKHFKKLIWLTGLNYKCAKLLCRHGIAADLHQDWKLFQAVTCHVCSRQLCTGKYTSKQAASFSSGLKKDSYKACCLWGNQSLRPEKYNFLHNLLVFLIFFHWIPDITHRRTHSPSRRTVLQPDATTP